MITTANRCYNHNHWITSGKQSDLFMAAQKLYRGRIDLDIAATILLAGAGTAMPGDALRSFLYTLFRRRD